MKKKVNDIFYSLQGEGFNTGRAAVFIRFAGCNLRCPFCDTEFDSYREMDDEEILTVVSDFRLQTIDYRLRTADCRLQTIDCRLQTTDYRLQTTDCRLQTADCRQQTIDYRLQTTDCRLLVVLTGGEPTLQVDEAFVDLLHEHGYEVAMESNGTRPAPRNLDWLTVSPKVLRGKTLCNDRSELRVERSEVSGQTSEIRGEWSEVSGQRLPDELKVIFDEHTDPEAYLPSPVTRHPSPPFLHPSPIKHLYLQPCDTGDAQRNADITARCIDYIKHHPWWRLSLQTHKLIGFK